MDFGFLKEEMMACIHDPFDHAMILYENDPLLPLLDQDTRDMAGHIVLIPFVPTAENLARHWYDLLAPRVAQQTENRARLSHVSVWETPNCCASYGGELL